MTQLGLTCEIDGADEQAISSWMPYRLEVSCDPESIEQGITCGMSDMCGEHPCLCGVADQWGDCACNGFETVAPTITVHSDNPYLVAFQLGGDWYLLGLAPGLSEFEVEASLNHYDDAQQSIHVACGTPGAPALIVIALLVAILAAVATLSVRRPRSKDDEPRR